MPCPTDSVTTENPPASATAWTAWPMSPTRFPGRHLSMPARSESSVIFMRRRAASLTRPTPTVRAASP